MLISYVFKKRIWSKQLDIHLVYLFIYLISFKIKQKL